MKSVGIPEEEVNLNTPVTCTSYHYFLFITPSLDIFSLASSAAVFDAFGKKGGGDEEEVII